MARNKEFKAPDRGAHKRLCFEVGQVGSNPASAIKKNYNAIYIMFLFILGLNFIQYLDTIFFR